MHTQTHTYFDTTEQLTYTQNKHTYFDTNHIKAFLNPKNTKISQI